MTKSQLAAATGSGDLRDDELHELEVLAHDHDSVPHLAMQRLVHEVYRLRHELADPRYMYASGRVHRAAIISRNAQIDELRSQLAEAKKLAVSQSPTPETK